MSCWLDPLQWPTCAAVAGANAVVAVASIPDGIAHSFGDAATSAVTWLWTQVSNATTIDLTTTGIRGDLAITAAIAVVITVALFCIQVIGCAMRGSFAGLGRSVRGLAIAFIGAAFAIGATQLLLTAVDALANGVVQAAVGQNIQQVGAELVAVASLGVLGWAGLLLMSLVLLAAVAFIWCALMIRKMLIVVAAVFAPIAFSGATADITKGWVRRWIEFTVALIFSKLILVVIFLIGLSMVEGAGATGSTTNQVTNLAIGTLTLLLAGFAPWMAIKMVHFAGDAFHHVHAQAGAAGLGAATVARTPQKASSLYAGARRVMGGPTGSRSLSSSGVRPAGFAGASTPKPSPSAGNAQASAPAISGTAVRPAVAPAPPGSGGAVSAEGGPISGGGHDSVTAASTFRARGTEVAVATLPRPTGGGDGAADSTWSRPGATNRLQPPSASSERWAPTHEEGTARPSTDSGPSPQPAPSARSARQTPQQQIPPDPANDQRLGA
jgi:hypothetical protein